ncbi:hypothetical protein Bca4012_078453 [Brassica carinata]
MAELRMTHRHATEDEVRQLRDNGFAAWLRSYEHQPDDVLHAPFWISKVECDPSDERVVVSSSLCTRVQLALRSYGNSP